MTSRATLLVGFSFVLSGGCGIAVDGDDGDGDLSGDGDSAQPLFPGDAVGDADGPPFPGDGNGYGDGDIAIGDGDGFVGPHRPYPPGGGAGVDLVACEESWGYSDATYCDLEYECENGWAYAYCDSYGSQTRCACDSPSGYLDFSFDENLGASACSSVIDYCTSVQPLAGVEPVCQQTYSEGDDHYCSSATECVREVQLTDGIKASNREWRDAWCDGYDDWICECWAGNSSMRVELSGDQESPDLCDDMLNLCGTGALSPTSDVTCQPQSQWADRDYCDVNLECTHSATYEGQGVSVFNYQYAGCKRASGDTWACWCGNPGADSFQLTSEGGWNACTEVASRCAR